MAICNSVADDKTRHIWIPVLSQTTRLHENQINTRHFHQLSENKLVVGTNDKKNKTRNINMMKMSLWALKYDPRNKKTCLWHIRTTKAQNSLRIRLISTFVVRCLDSIIPLHAIAEISRPLLLSSAEQAGLCLTWSQTSKTGFLVTRLIYTHSHIDLNRVDFGKTWATCDVKSM